MNNKDALSLIKSCRKDFLLGHPFLGDLSLRLAIKEDNGTTPTMATDGKHLFYNEEFVKGCSKDELSGVIAHEIGHCMFTHCGPIGVSRFKSFIKDFKDVACEYMVNHFVVDICNLPLPGKYYYDKKYADGTWTTESIYYDLVKKSEGKINKCKFSIATGRGYNCNEKGGGMTDDHGQWGQHEQNGDGDSASAGSESLEGEWKTAIIQALQNAARKSQGKLPAGLLRLIEDLVDAKIDWRTLLAEFLTRKSKDDFSYRRPSKRGMARGVYTPALYSDSVRVAYAMDTSGSMGAEELSEGLAEIRGICDTFSSHKLFLISCDAKVHNVQEVEPGDEIDIDGLGKGGGGTDFRPVFDKIQEDDLDIDALIYFTDAYGDFPDSPPDYPVMWVVKGGGEVPWGLRVDYL